MTAAGPRPAPARALALLPGVLLAVAVLLLAQPLAAWLGERMPGARPGTSAVPSGTLAIVLGLVLRNLAPLPALFQAGIAWVLPKALRLGVVLVGLKLSLFDVARLGALGIPIVAIAIATGLLFVGWFNRRLDLPPRMGTLIAAGTSICGVTAILSTAPAIKAEQREVAYAVANVTVFGLLGMLLYPYLAPPLFATATQLGMFFGVAVHDTAQVVGGAMTCTQLVGDERILQAATVTKLTRNVFLAAVVPLLALQHLRASGSDPAGGVARVRWSQVMPMFVLGFLALAAVRTLGEWTLRDGKALGLFEAGTWHDLVHALADVAGGRYLLGVAMAAVGLGTSLASLRGLGLKPFVVGFSGALVVALVGFALVTALGGMVTL
ncbi:MAG: putative sulfate exporter family transporter [Planctomycetes bacterium]|nr:putative sulfate exporter family transporter [Planctomycetota bacterium]